MSACRLTSDHVGDDFGLEGRFCEVGDGVGSGRSSKYRRRYVPFQWLMSHRHLTFSVVPYPDSRTHEYRQYYGPTPSPAQGPYGPQEPLDRRGLQSATGYDQYASQAQQGYPPQGYPPQGAYPLQGAYSGQDYPNTNQEYAVTSGGPYPNAGQPRTVPPYPPYQGMPNSEGTYSSTSYPSGSEGTPYNPPQSNMVQRGQQSSQPPPRGDQYRHNAYK